SHGVKLIGPQVDWNVPSPAVAALGPTVLNTVIPNPFLGVAPPSTTLGSLPTTTVGQMLLSFPQFTAVTSVNENLYNSNYHALTLRLEKRMSHGLTLLTSYTAGKSIDDGSGWNGIFQGQLGQTGGLGVSNRRLDRSISAYDRSQRLVTAITYELPFGAGRKFGSGSSFWRQVGGWQVSAISTFMTGLPIAMSRSAYIIGDVHSPDNGQGRYGVAPSNPWLNPAAFRPLTAGQISNIPRTMPDLRGPGTANTDLSLFKIFRLTEGVKLQLRGELFNAFNRTELGLPQTAPLSPTYGLITTTARRPREVQIGARLVF
ncbi:MAG: hypothetical protein HY238_08115, partial [Acidobacteria bacterium]|nr:hypothetical protein [Acidobacteriota bacterium]